MRIKKYGMRLDENKHPVLVEEKTTNYVAESVSTPKDIAKMCNEVFGLKDMAEEYVYAISMNAKCKVNGVFELSHVSVQKTVLSSRELFMRLLLSGAVQFVIVHNHPSGDPTPSNSDLQATRKLHDTSKLMDIELVDHIVLGDDGAFCSLREQYTGIFS